MVKSASRLVLLYGRTDKLDRDHQFLWSEWHTTNDIRGPDGWYVADPTFGFAWVKNGAGKRLDTSGLIAALQGEAPLLFGVIVDGAIREVPRLEMLAEQPTLRGLYYTPDKIPHYHRPASS